MSRESHQQFESPVKQVEEVDLLPVQNNSKIGIIEKVMETLLGVTNQMEVMNNNLKLLEERINLLEDV